MLQQGEASIVAWSNAFVSRQATLERTALPFAVLGCLPLHALRERSDTVNVLQLMET